MVRLIINFAFIHYKAAKVSFGMVKEKIYKLFANMQFSLRNCFPFELARSPAMPLSQGVALQTETLFRSSSWNKQQSVQHTGMRLLSAFVGVHKVEGHVLYSTRTFLTTCREIRYDRASAKSRRRQGRLFLALSGPAVL